MIGYATNESEEQLPLTMVYATKLALLLNKARVDKSIPWLGPDAKTQVTIQYKKENNQIKPLFVQTVLISTQHKKDITQDTIIKTVQKEIIEKVIPKEMIND